MNEPKFPYPAVIRGVTPLLFEEDKMQFGYISNVSL